jgi:multiple sugar transport system permease protein
MYDFDGALDINTLSFDNIYLLTQGGPSGSTYVMSIQSYYTAIYRGKIGYASAISVLMMVIIALAVLFYAIAKYAAARKELRNVGDING